MEWVVWTSSALLLLGGLVGSIVPALPGVGLILLATIIHKWFLPEFLSWWTVGLTAAAFVLSLGIDFMGTAMGAKWGGASKKGLYGALIGAVVGIFFGLPGLLLGPILGAMVGELIALRTPEQATRAGLGAGLGFAFSTFLRFLLALLVVIGVLLDCFI